MEEHSSNKNTLLLTIIAIATLLVAVVGATFAYFTAQTTAEASANIRVETSTSDSFGYGTFGALNIVATQQNFGPEMGSQKSSTSGEVTLTANKEESATYCYTVTINVSSNPFIYTTEGEKDQPDPELLIEIQKNNDVYTAVFSNLTYITIPNQRVCDQSPNAQEPKCQDEQIISGYDITTFGNTEIHQDGPKAIQIPVEDGVTSGEKPYVHTLTAGAGETKTDKWGITGTFVNLTDKDQEENTDKIFTATLNFATVNCTTGQPDPAE